MTSVSCRTDSIFGIVPVSLEVCRQIIGFYNGTTRKIPSIIPERPVRGFYTIKMSWFLQSLFGKIRETIVNKKWRLFLLNMAALPLFSFDTITDRYKRCDPINLGESRGGAEVWVIQ
jgi:hypothetical protein